MKTNIVAVGAMLVGCAGAQTETQAPAAPGESAANGNNEQAGETITVVKCRGISKQGHNDCGSVDGSHDCAAKAPVDNDPNEWVYVPEGPLCEKWGGTKWVKDGALVSKQKPVADFVVASEDPAQVTVVKCRGIAKQGHNDCGSVDGSHDCAGQSTQDNDPNEWVYVPEGPLCSKWAGEEWVKDGTLVKKQKPASDFLDG